MKKRSCRLLAGLGAAACLLLGVSASASSYVRARSRTHVNVNRNVHVNRNVNVNRNVYVHGGYYGGCCYNPHPVATAAAVTATAVATAAIVGSIVHTLPAGCTQVIVNGFAYQQCGPTWYQPHISGGVTTYVVVTAPR
jgi:hypothetical protein